MTSPIYNTLTLYDGKLQPQPELAESWDLSSDARQMKLNLRKGVKFHNGREFTADDVKWNILRVRDPKAATSQLAGQSNWITDIQTPDKYTVVLKFDAPRPAVFDMFEFLNILDPETMEGPDANRKAIGTGPFKFAEWIPGDQFRIVKNKDYWRTGRPYLDEVVYKIIGDTQTLMVQVESGNLDVNPSPTVQDAQRLLKDQKFTVITNNESGGFHYVALNVKMPPLDNKKVRQALSYAIDRKRFVDTALLGTAQPRALPWPATSPAYDKAKADSFAFNLDKAASMLKEAGASNLDFDFVYIANSAPAAALAQILQADLAKIGVKLQAKGVEAAVQQDMTGKVTYRGMASNNSTFSMLDPSSLFTLSRPWRFDTNASGYQNEKYMQLTTALGTEPDPAKRKQLMSDINDFILDEAFVLVVSTAPTNMVMRANVQGMKTAVSGYWVLGDTWIAQ
jgi:peptide/nickel transport system substrate-binding protein